MSIPSDDQRVNVVINNSASANANANAGTHRRGYRRQSLWVHFWLLLLTAGIGNIIYAVHVSRWNRRHGY